MRMNRLPIIAAVESIASCPLLLEGAGDGGGRRGEG